jgi:copper chaperone CopZ
MLDLYALLSKTLEKRSTGWLTFFLMNFHVLCQTSSLVFPQPQRNIYNRYNPLCSCNFALMKSTTFTIDGMTCSGCVAGVQFKLESHPEISKASVSIAENAFTITTSSEAPTASDLEALLDSPKYHVSAASSSSSSPTTFKPLIIIALFLTGISALTADGLHDGMNNFMAGFFLTFSFFKFLDLKSFAQSYAMYDLLAMRSKIYAYSYPFIELALGCAYLTHFAPKETYIATLIVMGFSTIGVVKSVVDKKQIKCACLGSVFNLPMTTVTIVEDLMMVGMAAYMLLTV